jgi:L-threonylcarbamoyladenylate synthase
MNEKSVRNALLKGNLVILPTETVYGIACLEKYSKKLYALKNKPTSASLARIYGSKKAVLANYVMSEFATIAVNKLLPGPFTLLLNDKDRKIGVRVPDHKMCVECIKGIKKPIVMSSCNLHGQSPAKTFEEAKRMFPELDGLDGGECKYGKASMILDITNDR